MKVRVQLFECGKKTLPQTYRLKELAEKVEEGRHFISAALLEYVLRIFTEVVCKNVSPAPRLKTPRRSKDKLRITVYDF